MKAGMRISALIKKKIIYILTHDSIGLGEDGPTHQPIEQLAHMRAIPNMITLRPADAMETSAAWKFALQHKTGPVCLVLTRQNLPVLHPSNYPVVGEVDKGGYVLSDILVGSSEPKIILIASGSEVSLALSAQKKLAEEKISSRVVSMPSMELFDQQPLDYRESVLPSHITARLSIEAASTFGWGKYVGFKGDSIGMMTFGASAPGGVAMEKFGFNVDNVIKKAKNILP
jgi:transketolase